MVKIDKGLKDRVAKKAKMQDLSLSDFVKIAFHAYDQGLIKPGLIQRPEKFNAKTRKEIEQALKDIKTGKNLSPAFSSIKEMDNYLDSL
jgi:hypothetical protein